MAGGVMSWDIHNFSVWSEARDQTLAFSHQACLALGRASHRTAPDSASSHSTYSNGLKCLLLHIAQGLPG